MKLNFEKKNAKSAIVILNGRFNFCNTDVAQIQLFQFEKALKEIYGRSLVDFVSHPMKRDLNKVSNYKDISATDLNDYDEVFCYECSPNFFGGNMNSFNSETLKKLAWYKGTIYYILSDPRFPCLNFAEIIKYKAGLPSTFSIDGEPLTVDSNGKLAPNKFITDADLEQFSKNVFPKIITCFNGYDYDEYVKQYYSKKRSLNARTKVPENKDWCEFAFFEDFAIDLQNKADMFTDYPFEDKKYDLCYYGLNRRNERNKIIKELYKNPEDSKLFIGFDDLEGIPNATRIDRTERGELFSTICKNSKATIVIGDFLHNNNCITFRFFEAMLMDVVALVYDDYDSKHTLIKDEFLKSFVYVKTAEDVKDRLAKIRNDEALYKKIVALEREEAKRIIKYYQEKRDSL